MKINKITFLLSFLICGITTISGCATPPVVRINEGEIPASLQILEKEIRGNSRRFQDIIDRCGVLYHDAELESYLNAIGRKIVPPNSNSTHINFLFKIMRDPTVNAFTFMDGCIYIHTGLLSRLENEAQLAFVLAHEIAHVINRDLLYVTENYHKKTIAAKIFDIALTPGYRMVPYSGAAELGANIAYAASVSGYGRRIEARADREALNLVAAGGYSLEESKRVFDVFLAEKERYRKGVEVYFLSNHPSNKKRKKIIDTIRTTDFHGYAGTLIGADQFAAHMIRLRCENAALNIRKGRYFHAVDDVARVLAIVPNYAPAYFYQGEAYRNMVSHRRKVKDELNPAVWRKIVMAHDEQIDAWRAAAITAYEKAIYCDKAYADAYRGLALIYQENEKDKKAMYYFDKYLALEPHATDQRFIMWCLDNMDDISEEESSEGD